MNKNLKLNFSTRAVGSLIFYLFALNAVHSQTITYDGCRDFRGIPVASVSSNVDNVAIATLGSAGEPIIFYNENVLSYFHPITRLFWYFHECGHHALGHTFGNIPVLREKQADCWAIVNMYQLGMLDQNQFAIIQSDISQLSGDGWVYLPGHQRALSFSYCVR